LAYFGTVQLFQQSAADGLEEKVPFKMIITHHQGPSSAVVRFASPLLGGYRWRHN
jgi:hypothetical protein